MVLRLYLKQSDEQVSLTWNKYVRLYVPAGLLLETRKRFRNLQCDGIYLPTPFQKFRNRGGFE